MITLWGRKSSINVQKVMWALGELGLAYDHIDAGGDAGGLDDPAFRAMNPHGRVPVLRDGELTLWESNAIVRYLCGHYGAERLCPATPAGRARCDTWMDWTATELQPAIMGLFWSFYRTPAAQRDAHRVADRIQDSAEAIRTLDHWLQSRRFIAGETLSMSDIPAGTLMHRYFGMEVEHPDAPAVAAWRARLEARAPYRKAVMRPFDDLYGRLAF
jgi:glutathione S-transferase